VKVQLMNSRCVIGGFVLVIACVLIYKTVAPQVVVNRGVSLLQGIIKEIQGWIGLSENYSEILVPARSKLDVFLYYVSQAGMVFGVIIIVIGIFSEEIGVDLFTQVRERVFPTQTSRLPKEVSREERDEDFSEIGRIAPTVPPSMPPDVQELANKCTRGEIAVTELEDMFVKGKIDWKQYNVLRSLCAE
jgi:hypothetical protein